MNERPSWAPDDVDITRPSVARIYDFVLGGSHNFAADREFAAQLFAAMPDAPRMARDNRAFLRRAVRHLSDAGVDQFLDLGSGIPTVGNVHETAHAADPGARVVYVDNDPVAVTHSRELLAGDDRILVHNADLRDPAGVLPGVVGHLDLSRPVGLLFVSVLHFIQDSDDPIGFIRAYVAAVAPGSHLVISHGTSDGGDDAEAAAAVYNRSRSTGGTITRSAAETGALFGDLPLVEPGLVRMPLWRPDVDDEVDPQPDRHVYLAGVGRKD